MDWLTRSNKKIWVYKMDKKYKHDCAQHLIGSALRTSGILFLLLVLTLAAVHAESPAIGTLEIVAELDVTPANVVVSKDGRLFATIHAMRPADVKLIEITGKKEWRPFPNENWQQPRNEAGEFFVSPHGMVVDQYNKLWVIDHGQLAENPRPPRLLAFDLMTNEPVFSYEFARKEYSPDQFMQDLAVDAYHGYVYIADSGSRSIVVVDIDLQEVFRFDGHDSLQAENVDLIVDGRVVTRQVDGESRAVRVGVNPVTLSKDGETLFYGAMNGTSWYSIPANLLRDRAPSQDLAEAVTVVGNKPLSDGVSTDAEGNHFITDLQNNAIVKLSPDGQLTTLVKDERIQWADNLRFGKQSWLYIAINQLHRTAALNGGVDKGVPPYLIGRVWTGTEGIAGR